MSTATVQKFLLPDVGEGLTEAEIVTWHVGVGDTITVNQVIVDIETAKSVVELPSPFAGTVLELHAAEGETVPVGSTIITVGDPEKGERVDLPTQLGDDVQTVAKEPGLLVGYGPREPARRRRRSGVEPIAPATTRDVEIPGPNRPRAKPPVRSLAKQLGVDLGAIRPTGEGGVITRDDVRLAQEGAASPTTTVETSDGDVRIPIKGVRKRTAEAMVASAFTAPHVTEFLTLDVTATMELRERVLIRREFADVKVSPLTFIASAFLRAMQSIPSANARWDEAAQEIVQLGEVNLGIAAATPRGLVVPNIKSAQRLPFIELARAIADLASTAKEGRTAPEDMSRGTVTISNFGVFGVDSGTPILNPGETAILGVGTISRRPWVVGSGPDERIEARWVTTLALSFDHRVMDGAEGSVLLGTTGSLLHDPGLAVLA